MVRTVENTFESLGTEIQAETGYSKSLGGGTHPDTLARCRDRSSPARVKNKHKLSLYFISARRQEPSPGELIQAQTGQELWPQIEREESPHWGQAVGLAVILKVMISWSSEPRASKALFLAENEIHLVLSLRQDKAFLRPIEMRKGGRRKPGDLQAPQFLPWFPATSLSISYPTSYVVAMDHSRGITDLCEAQRSKQGVHTLHGKLRQAEQNLDPQWPRAVLFLSLVCWVSL